MIRFEDIQEQVEQRRPGADLELLRRAYIFSAMVHRGQTRYSGEPYLTHPLAVAHILADLDLDEQTVATGLLHDTVEDAEDPHATAIELEGKFGREIANLVDGVTKLKRLEFASAEERQAENLRKLMLAMVDDIRVVLVKLADRLHNMRTLEHVPAHKQRRIAVETMEIYVPLANRLGLGQIKGELENLALRYGDPEIFRQLTDHLEANKEVIEALIAQVGGTLDDQLKEHGITAKISGRVKGISSILRKMRVQEIEVQEVYDVVAFRILTDTVKDCYGALGIIHSIWPPVPGRIKDYIAMPKPNLYQSLHTSVMSERGFPFEIQIRTEEMHELAEHGIAAHWRYKDRDQKLSREEVSGVQWLRQVLEFQQDVRDSQEFMRYVKIDLFPEEVHVFTPKGKVVTLSRGATPIDFAYTIHTEVGHQCVGAKINGRLVPLKTELKSGDIVEIRTQSGHEPSRDWLVFVKTARARSKIRAHLKRIERERSVELGRSLLEKELRRASISFKTLEDEHKAALREEFKVPTLDDLMAALGAGRITPSQVLKVVAPDKEAKEEEAPSILSRVTRALGRGKRADKVLVRGMGDTMVSLAGCCRPIPGDEIVGYITRGRGVSVHTESCPNLEQLLLDENRKIEVEWASAGGASRFDVGIRIVTANRPGQLRRIAELLEQEKINIRHAGADVDSEREEGVIMVIAEVENRKQVERIIEKIRRIGGVRQVRRVAPSL